MRTNPFDSVYKQCNSSDYTEKLNNPGAFPKCIDIEVTNACNFRCLMCPTGLGLSKRPKGFMSESLYRKIIKEISKHGTPLRFIRCGEPTLHKLLPEFIKIAKENNILCHLNTNGSKLTPEYIKTLIDSGLDSIKISFQGIDGFSYNEMRAGGDYETLIENAKELYSIRRGAEKPYIHISTTVTYETPDEIGKFKKSVRKFCDLVTVGKTVLDYINVASTNLSFDDKIKLNNIIRLESVNKVHPHCPEVFDKLSIDWDGGVTACCWDYDNYMKMGDLDIESLEDIWQCENLKSYRHILYNMNHDSLKLCRNCYDYIELKK